MDLGSLLRTLSVVPSLTLLLLAGCASFPGPSSENDSLFVVIGENPAPGIGPRTGIDTLHFAGPSPFIIRVGSEERRAYCVRVKPGRYTLAESDVVAGAEPAAASVSDVPAGAVFLFPMKVTRVRRDPVRVSLVPLVPEDQKNASALLVDYLDYEKWFGRVVVGFGAYPPRLGNEEGDFEFDISSSPSGARVTIDDQEWGTTPVKTTLHTGKHLMQLEIPGVALTRSFVDVRSKGEINVTLPLLATQQAKDLKDKSQRITILLSAFQNMGSPENDTLKLVFPEVIGADLKTDSRIDLVDAGELVAHGGGIPGKPDFALANQKGIDLIVSGYYTARQDGLLVYAALYDVQSELPRTSIMYTGSAGLAMFDSIDSMAADFIKGIDRVLPGVRAHTVLQGGTVENRIVTYEKKRSETAIIEKREAMKNSLSFIIGPSFATFTNIQAPAFPYSLFANVPFGVVFDHSLGGPLSLTAILQPGVAFGPIGPFTSSEYTVLPYLVPYLDIPLKFGPAYTVSGYNVDLTFGLLGETRFTQAWFWDNSSSAYVYKGIWVFGLNLETSARLYLQSRISDRPSFIFLGFGWYLIGMRTEADLSGPQFEPIELSFILGYGFRL
ncbi:MAG: PEGA domain-containing protein [Spirochaetia bacterium]|jgi:hypothetical protein